MLFDVCLQVTDLTIIVSQMIKIFFVQFFWAFLLVLLNLFYFHQVHTVSILYCAHLCMKYSVGISNLLEEVSSLSHSIVFLYFFAFFTQEDFLISPCYSLKLLSDGYMLTFLLYLSILFLAICRASQTTILPFCISFSWE